ncbi:hypothetical protein P8452_12822 [Trifolium repens]|nr:hypothetical protein P8452_12822 [Trifolium repens]
MHKLGALCLILKALHLNYSKPDIFLMSGEDQQFFQIVWKKGLFQGPPIVQFLLKKGLREKNASLTYPFGVSEKLFLDKFIKRFKEESSDLLKLYEEKLNLAYTTDKTCM